METPRRLCSGIGLATIMLTSLVLVQPSMNAYSVGTEGVPSYDDCEYLGLFLRGEQPEDPISMNSVRNGNIVKTIHAEKEIFRCFLDQGNLQIIVDVTTYIEVYENILTKEVIATSATSVTCIKDEATGTVIDCESKPVSSSPVPVGHTCFEASSLQGEAFRDLDIEHPQEMNTVIKGNTAKTIEAQKEVFFCALDFNSEACEGNVDPFIALGCANTRKKVDLILFTETYEDLTTQTVTDVQFHVMRCVVLISDEARTIVGSLATDLRDATVETCQFSTIQD